MPVISISAEQGQFMMSMDGMEYSDGFPNLGEANLAGYKTSIYKQ